MSLHASVRSTIGSALVIMALVATSAGCDEAPAGSASPSGTAATSSPPAATSTPLPTAAPTPAPTRLPSPVAGAWVAAGSTVRDYLAARILALPDGGAVLIGTPVDEEGSALLGVIAVELWSPTTGWRTGASTDARSSAAGAARTSAVARDPVLVDRVNGAPTETSAVVVLRDGRLLVAGGDDGAEHSIASVSIYDPGRDTWTAAAPMGQARSHASAALLPDGRVVVVGGFAWEPFQDAGRVDGVQLARVVLLDVAPQPLGPALATAEVFDPASGTWSTTGPMRYARTGPAIATLADGRILVVGASAEAARTDGRAYTTAEVYDPATGRFTSAGTVLLPDPEALARVGVDLPDAAPDSFGLGTLIGLPDGGAALIGESVRWKHEAQVVWSSRLAPGLAAWRVIGEPFAVHELNDGEHWGIQTTGVSREGALVAGLVDGAVFVGGGSPFSEVPLPAAAPVSTLRYDAASESWTFGPSFPEPRDGPLGVSLSDWTILLVGGRHQVGSGDEATYAWAREAWRLMPGAWGQ